MFYGHRCRDKESACDKLRFSFAVAHWTLSALALDLHTANLDYNPLLHWWRQEGLLSTIIV